MGWFGLIITSAILLAVVCAVLYVIYNIIYHAAYTSKGIAVVSFIVNVLLIIIIATDTNGPVINDGEFLTSTVGVIAAAGIGLAFATVAFFVGANDGDDMGAGISESVGSTVILTSVAIILQCFADTFWPLFVLLGIGIVLCFLAWVKGD